MLREPVQRTIYDNYDLWDDENVTYAKEDLEDEGNDNPTEEDIWEKISDIDASNYDDEMERLGEFFDDGSTWILIGTSGRWDGTYDVGTIFTDFVSTFRKAIQDCDYIKLYDENGHFYLTCSHHDGTNHYEIKKLTEKGVKYLENWEEDWDDKRTERYIHDMIMKKYSVLPHFAHKVYGCPKVQWKKEAG